MTRLQYRSYHLEERGREGDKESVEKRTKSEKSMTKKVNEDELETEAMAEKEVDKQQLGEAVDKEPANEDTSNNMIEVETVEETLEETVELVVAKDGILKEAEEKKVGKKSLTKKANEDELEDEENNVEEQGIAVEELVEQQLEEAISEEYSTEDTSNNVIGVETFKETMEKTMKLVRAKSSMSKEAEAKKRGEIEDETEKFEEENGVAKQGDVEIEVRDTTDPATIEQTRLAQSEGMVMDILVMETGAFRQGQEEGERLGASQSGTKKPLVRHVTTEGLGKRGRKSRTQGKDLKGLIERGKRKRQEEQEQGPTIERGRRRKSSEQKGEYLQRKTRSQTLELKPILRRRIKTCEPELNKNIERCRRSKVQDRELSLKRSNRSKTLDTMPSLRKRCSKTLEHEKEKQVGKNQRRRNEKILFCSKEGCKARFPQRKDISDHMKSVHGQSELICGVEGCSKAYLSTSGFYNHRQTIHSIGKKGTFSCSEDGCEAKFYQKTNFSDHMRSVHDQSKLVCDVEGCSKAYNTIAGLWYHEKTIHSSSSKDLKQNKARVTRERRWIQEPLVKRRRRSVSLMPAPTFGMGEQDREAYQDEAAVEEDRVTSKDEEAASNFTNFDNMSGMDLMEDFPMQKSDISFSISSLENNNWNAVDMMETEKAEGRIKKFQTSKEDEAPAILKDNHVALDLVEDIPMEEGWLNFSFSPEKVVGEGREVSMKNRIHIQEELAVREKSILVEEGTAAEDLVEDKINAPKDGGKTTADEERSLATEDDDSEDIEDIMEVSDTESSSDESDVTIRC